jgi:hypothetical protein
MLQHLLEHLFCIWLTEMEILREKKKLESFCLPQRQQENENSLRATTKP